MPQRFRNKLILYMSPYMENYEDSTMNPYQLLYVI